MERVGTLSEMLEELIHLGEATGTAKEAHELRGELEGRLARLRAVTLGAPGPRVVALQSLDPLRVAGLWVPEMISIAGGEDVAGHPGLAASGIGWGELASLRPAIVLLLTGEVDDSRATAMECWDRLAGLGAGGIFAVEAPAFLDAGPRLVDAVELLAHLFHPHLIDPPGGTGFVRLRAPVAWVA